MANLEQHLWRKIQSGDLRSFELLFNDYSRGLYCYAFDLLHNKEDAEENVMDLFHALWENRKTINIRTSLKAYLFRSLHNQCINSIRHREIVARKKSVYIEDTLKDEEMRIPFSETFLLDRLIGAELEKSLEEALAALPGQCREVFQLSRFQNLKIREIAEKLTISESTVKTQLFRAIEKLRDLLKPYLD
ncbi:MAG: RNA polymerase sigma-70 factor [Bacteroidales bacterium]|nr:RNA polymerase sigma-70 factor [Bacteroidales bacterium]